MLNTTILHPGRRRSIDAARRGGIEREDSVSRTYLYSQEKIMSGKKILAIVLAVIVGIVAVRILFWLLSVAFSMLSWLLYFAVAAVVVYALYRGFMSMLNSGKRFT
jgi:hypothetical protein